MPDSVRADGPRVDGSMSLLVDMSVAALDPSYAEAAARREAGERPSSFALSRGILAGIVLVGLGTGVAAAQTRESADELSQQRRALMADIAQRTSATDRLSSQAGALRREVTAIADGALAANGTGQALAAEIAALELATGAGAVRGPGLVVTLEDAEDAPAGLGEQAQPGDGRILDRDVQDVVNALWLAGAEAIAINDQRVTTLTAIRSAGEAILVDLRPLSPPYVIEAIGDVDTLEPTFVDGATARRFQTWTSLYGLGFDLRRSTDLRLPAGGLPELRLARSGGTP